MDNRDVETGTPEGLPVQSNLDTQYSVLDKIFIQCDLIIPSAGLEIWEGGLSGRLVDRQKKFSGVAALAHVRKILQDRFPEELQQSQIVSSASHFMESISSHMTPERNTFFFGQLDRFLSEFPANMIDRLGNQATTETVSRIIRIGSEAYDREIERIGASERELISRVSRELNKETLNMEGGTVSLLVGEAIPEAIIAAGENSQTLLARIEDLAKTSPFSDFRNFVEYYQTHRQPSEREKARIRQFEETLKGRGIDIDTSDSVFNQADRQPWRKLRTIGAKEDVATWEDLGAMVRATEVDNLEYGITIGKDGAQYWRGSENSIFNGDRNNPSKEIVFFHAHPSTTREKEVVAPLVSQGDLMANLMHNYGGGYMNVVCTSGVTLHIGGTIPEDQIEPPIAEKKAAAIYTVESGDFKDSTISPKETYTETLETMLKLKESGIPYVYSIYDPVMKVKYWFVHIPWGYLDRSLEVKSLCFENGLVKMLSNLESLPKLPETQNLVQGIEDSLKELRDTRRRRLEQVQSEDTLKV